MEVNACPGPDLRKILEDLRCQYETLMERNRKETEQWYACKVLYTCRAVSYSASWGKGEKRENKNTYWRHLNISDSVMDVLSI